MADNESSTAKRDVEMKQYGTASTNYACHGSNSPINGTTITYEALIGTSYDSLTRSVRRDINGNAERWWRRQMLKQYGGAYHCGGAGQ